MAQLRGQGGSSVVVTAWFWSTLWKDCYKDSTARVNFVDFWILWTVKRVYSHDKMIHFYISFITPTWHITVFVISLLSGSQGAPGDRPLPRCAHHGAYIFRTWVHTHWRRPLMQTQCADDGRCCPFSVHSTSQNICMLAGLVFLPLGVISLFSCRCIRPVSLLFIHKQSDCSFFYTAKQIHQSWGNMLAHQRIDVRKHSSHACLLSLSSGMRWDHRCTLALWAVFSFL